MNDDYDNSYDDKAILEKLKKDGHYHDDGRCCECGEESHECEDCPMFKDVERFKEFECPECGWLITGLDLDGKPCDDCRKKPSCHSCQWEGYANDCGCTVGLGGVDFCPLHAAAPDMWDFVLTVAAGNTEYDDLERMAEAIIAKVEKP